MRKTRRRQGEPCFLGFSEQNATLKKRSDFRRLYNKGTLQKKLTYDI